MRHASIPGVKLILAAIALAGSAAGAPAGGADGKSYLPLRVTYSITRQERAGEPVAATITFTPRADARALEVVVTGRGGLEVVAPKEPISFAPQRRGQRDVVKVVVIPRGAGAPSYVDLSMTWITSEGRASQSLSIPVDSTAGLAPAERSKAGGLLVDGAGRSLAPLPATEDAGD